MKIYDVTKIYGVYENKPVTGRSVRKETHAAKSDKLMLSKGAVDFQAVMAGLKEAPDVRADKIAALAEKYKAGKHLADSKDIDEALLQSGVINKTHSQP